MRKLNFQNIINFIFVVIIIGVFFVYPLFKLTKIIGEIKTPVSSQTPEVNNVEEIFERLDKEIQTFLK